MNRIPRKATPITERRHQEWWMNHFREANEKDLRDMGANDKQVAELKKRQARRGYGFERGDDRVKKETEQKKSVGPSKPADKGGAIVKAEPSSIKKAESSAITKAGTSALAKRPESKGGALAKTNEVTPASGGPKPDRKPKPYSTQKPQPNINASKINKAAKSAGSKALKLAGRGLKAAAPGIVKRGYTAGQKQTKGGDGKEGQVKSASKTRSFGKYQGP
tara:strand:+ start:2389 stop:3048 length:660 start_codon:yes stop_codon:yes gene_type:complete